MKREVASSLVERGVAERVRLTQAYEKKKAELQKQQDIVKTQLNDHKEKVSKVESFYLRANSLPILQNTLKRRLDAEFKWFCFVLVFVFVLGKGFT